MRLLPQPQREQVGAYLQALEALAVGPLGADASTEPASPTACLSKRWKTVGGGSVFSLVYVFFCTGWRLQEWLHGGGGAEPLN